MHRSRHPFIGLLSLTYYKSTADYAFATAIFELGLKQASPKVLMNTMKAAPPESMLLTTEHIKSHLQKFRLHHNKSPKEWEAFYWVRRKKN